jgi:hypothetical protein
MAAVLACRAVYPCPAWSDRYDRLDYVDGTVVPP